MPRAMRVTRRFLALNGAAILLGAAVGLAAVGFRLLIDLIQNVSFSGDFTATPGEENRFIVSQWGWLVILVPALGGLAVGIIRKTWPETRQQGVAEVMAAVQARGGILRGRSSWGHALISAITVGTGGSTGREGPIGYIGASVGSSLARRLGFRPRDIKVLLGAGFATGIGATFNAPLGGVLLALELVLPEFSAHAFIPVVLASVVGVAVSQIILGDEATFTTPEFVLESLWELPVYLLLGVLCGLGGVAFIRTMGWSQKMWAGLPLTDWLKPTLGGLAVGIMGLAVFEWNGQYHLFGTGYATVSALLVGDGFVLAIPVLLVLIILKPLATATTIGSGGGGGVFSASLFVGALYGGFVGLLAEQFAPGFTAPAVSYALVGMGAFYAATARATLTAIVIMTELVNDYTMLLPLMLCAITADAVSIALSRESIYTVRLTQKGILYDHDRVASPLDFVQVKDVMTKDVHVLDGGLTVGEAFARMLDIGHTGYPVLDGEGKLAGIVTRRDLSKQLHAGRGDEKLKDIVSGLCITCTPDEVLHRARDRIFQQDIGRLIVVDPEDRRRMVGILTRSDLLRAEAEKDVEHGDFFSGN